MAGIPEHQLTSWAQIGAQETSKATYATVKLALEKEGTPYQGKAHIFLQGSYGNDTNIYKESDVDVVIRLDTIFTYDIGALPQAQKDAFVTTHPASVYTHREFQRDVLKVLTDCFKTDVDPGDKAVLIKPSGNRREADVLIAIKHRKYTQYTGTTADNPMVGISFHKKDGTRIANYPDDHRKNLIAKNQASNEWFKHLIRIFKNARQKLIEENVISDGDAPSYYIEGLLYNVPTAHFGTSYASSFENVLRSITESDRRKFFCAHRQYPLLDGNSDVTWNTAHCDAYINGLVGLWNDW